MSDSFGQGPFGAQTSATPPAPGPFGQQAGPFGGSPAGPLGTASPTPAGPFGAGPFGGAGAPTGTPAAGPFGGSVAPVGTGGFGGPELAGSGGAVVVHRPPVLILAGCIALVIAAALGAWLSGLVVVAFVCWFLAGPVGTGLLAFFQNRDSAARASGVYTRDGWVTPAFYAAVVLCLAAVTLCAFRIAMWAGRL